MEQPHLWTRIEYILRSKVSVETRFFALQILEEFCRLEFGFINQEQKEGLRILIFDLIEKTTRIPNSNINERLFLEKLDLILVKVIKHDLPQKWPKFVADIVTISQGSEELCENTMLIFKLLSDEVSDFSKNEMIQVEIEQLKTYLSAEFGRIQDFCYFVMSTSRKNSLLKVTMKAFSSCVYCVSTLSILNSRLVYILQQLVTDIAICNYSLSCLNEICTLKVEDGLETNFLELYRSFLALLFSNFSLSIDIQMVYLNGSQEDQTFFQELTFFISTLFKVHIHVLERQIEFHDQLCV
jgi:exportin-1